jgi:Gpi18-like mannosyltransferase
MALSHRAYTIILFVAAGLFTAVLSTRPYYNWDIFPYMALTLGPGNHHTTIFQEAAREMPAHDFEAITSRQPLLYQDPGAFQAILPYYQSKPGYLLLTRLLYRSGIHAITATYLPSLVAYFVLVIIMGYWLVQYIETRHALVVMLIIAALPFLSMTARFSSPDMLCAAFTIAGLYVISKHRTPWAIVFWMLAIASRPDAVLLVLPLVYCVWADGITQKRLAWATAIAATTTAIWSLGDLKLLPDYAFTLKPWPGEFTPMELASTYAFNLIHGLPSVINSSLPVFILILALVWIYSWSYKTRNKFWRNCMTAALVSLIARYLLHPIMEDRFVISAYLIILMGSVHTFFSTAQNTTSDKRHEYSILP